LCPCAGGEGGRYALLVSVEIRTAAFWEENTFIDKDLFEDFGRIEVKKEMVFEQGTLGNRGDMDAQEWGGWKGDHWRSPLHGPNTLHT
jgi:hypothetical protein